MTPITSLLTNLKNQNSIPSLSWGYAAGSHQMKPKILGSLTLGGYDSARFMPNGASFPFGPDSNQDLLVGLESMSFDDTDTSFFWTEIFVFLNSSDPDMWLPISICETLK